MFLITTRNIILNVLTCILNSGAKRSKPQFAFIQFSVSFGPKRRFRAFLPVIKSYIKKKTKLLT